MVDAPRSDAGLFTRRRLTMLIAGIPAALALGGCSSPAAPATPAATVTAKAVATAPAKAAATAPANPAATAPAKPVATAPKSLEQTNLKVAAVRGLYENVYAMLGVEKGIYRNYGLANVEFMELPGGKQQVDSVVAGEADWCETGLAAPFASMEQGSGLRLFAAPRPRINFVLIGSKDINQPTDLLGKTIGTAALGSQLHTLVLAYLDKQGLDPEKVNFVNIGSSVDVAKAVFTKKVDAGPVTNDLAFEVPKYPDTKVIANLSTDIPDFLRVAVFASDKLLDTKPEFMTTATLAYSESLRYALDHRAEAVALSMKLTGLDQPSTERNFDLYLSDRQINPNLDFSTAQVAYMQELHIKLGVQKATLPADKIVDTRYYKTVIEKLGKYVPKS